MVPGLLSHYYPIDGVLSLDGSALLSMAAVCSVSQSHDARGVDVIQNITVCGQTPCPQANLGVVKCMHGFSFGVASYLRLVVGSGDFRKSGSSWCGLFQTAHGSPV